MRQHAGEKNRKNGNVRKIAGILLMAVCLWALAATARADGLGSSGSRPGSGVRQNADGSYSANMVTSVPVVPLYCFYSAYMRDYMWTISEDEKQYLENALRTGKETYQYQGISGYVQNYATDQNLPVYRFWNKKTTDHFYTTNAVEKQQLEADLASGKDNYVYEGIAWYVPVISDYPVYRFYDTAAFNHYYTSDPQLQVSLAQAYLNGTGTYRYEGIAWYWFE